MAVRPQGGLRCLLHELPPRGAEAQEAPHRRHPLGDPDQQALLRQDALHLFGPPRLHERRGGVRDRFRTLDLYFEEYGDTTENAVQGTQVRPRRTRTAERARRLLQGGPRALRREREDLSGQSRHRAMGT